jgi:poly-beta-1,6-N-acetyl-D-glucosamine N-deacetylase
MGVQHVGYYPDVPFSDHPDPAALKAVLDAKPNAPSVR